MFRYRAPLRAASKLARRIYRAVNKDTYSRALETEFAASPPRKSRRTARGKGKP
jgi:hypothetical protein